MPEYRFPLGGSDLQGRIVGLAFFVAGLFLLALAGLLAVQTTMWLGARERIEGTVVAVEHGSHAVVEGQAIDGRWMRRASARRRSWDLRRVSR